MPDTELRNAAAHYVAAKIVLADYEFDAADKAKAAEVASHTAVSLQILGYAPEHLGSAGTDFTGDKLYEIPSLSGIASFIVDGDLYRLAIMTLYKSHQLR